MKKKTWKVLSWDQTQTGSIELSCPNCGNDAHLPTHGEPGALVIAAMGLSLIFDPAGHVPPKEWMPYEIKCRKCGAIYEDKENVR